MKTVKVGEVTVLKLGSDDLVDPAAVHAAFEEIVGLLDRRKILLDLSAVGRLTSSGVSAIAAGARLASSEGAELSVSGLRPEVRKALRRVLEGNSDLKFVDGAPSGTEGSGA